MAKLDDVYKCAAFVMNLYANKKPNPSYTGLTGSYQDYFIQKNWRVALNLTLYFTYVDYAVEKDIRLFKEDFHAWDRGPSISELYDYILPEESPELYVKNHRIRSLKNTELEEKLTKNFNEIMNKGVSIVLNNVKNTDVYKHHYCQDLQERIRTEKDLMPYEEIKEYYSVRRKSNKNPSDTSYSKDVTYPEEIKVKPENNNNFNSTDDNPSM